jgi:hypothetical protein
MIPFGPIPSRRLGRIRGINNTGTGFPEDLLSITAVHPIRRDAVDTLLLKHDAGADELQRLIREGLITMTSSRPQIEADPVFRENACKEKKLHVFDKDADPDPICRGEQVPELNNFVYYVY